MLRRSGGPGLCRVVDVRIQIELRKPSGETYPRDASRSTSVPEDQLPGQAIQAIYQEQRARVVLQRAPRRAHIRESRSLLPGWPYRDPETTSRCVSLE